MLYYAPKPKEGQRTKTKRKDRKMDKALIAAIRDLYTDALCEERGKVLRLKIRRLAKRFLPQEDKDRAMDESRIRGYNL